MRPLNAASPKHFKLSYKVWKKEKKKREIGLGLRNMCWHKQVNAWYNGRTCLIWAAVIEQLVCCFASLFAKCDAFFFFSGENNLRFKEAHMQRNANKFCNQQAKWLLPDVVIVSSSLVSSTKSNFIERG